MKPVEPVCDYSGTLPQPQSVGDIMATTNLTPIEKRIDTLLNDGMEHNSVELLKCIDSLATLNQLSFHMTNLRNKLEPHGLSIVTRVRKGTTIYYKVRRLRTN